jgi:hypothetical protein
MKSTLMLENQTKLLIHALDSKVCKLKLKFLEVQHVQRLFTKLNSFSYKFKIFV